jgi:hypothetical protein
MRIGHQPAASEVQAVHSADRGALLRTAAVKLMRLADFSCACQPEQAAAIEAVRR